MSRFNLSSIPLAFVSLISSVRGISLFVCVSGSPPPRWLGGLKPLSGVLGSSPLFWCRWQSPSHLSWFGACVVPQCKPNLYPECVRRTVASYLRPFNVLLVEKAEFSLWGSISFVQHGPNVRSLLFHRWMLADMESCWRSSAEGFLRFVRRRSRHSDRALLGLITLFHEWVPGLEVHDEKRRFCDSAHSPTLCSFVSFFYPVSILFHLLNFIFLFYFYSLLLPEFAFEIVFSVCETLVTRTACFFLMKNLRILNLLYLIIPAVS